MLLAQHLERLVPCSHLSCLRHAATVLMICIDLSNRLLLMLVTREYGIRLSHRLLSCADTGFYGCVSGQQGQQYA